MIKFKYAVPLEQTMDFEAVYPEELQLELEEKRELWNTPGAIFVWMYVYGQLAGESYGTPIASSDEELAGLSGLSKDEKGKGFHCYSNTILPDYHGQGYGTLLKSHWLGLVAGKGYGTVYGHARSGASQALNSKFGAVFIQTFEDWYGTGEEYRLYRLELK